MTGKQPGVVNKAADRDNVRVLHAPTPLTSLEKSLLNEYQRDLPLCASPFAKIAEELGVSERLVIDTLASLLERGLISRVGPVFAPQRVGASTLAAMAVPAGRLPEVAEFVGNFVEVNHNYEREHDVNLWFVITASDRLRVDQILDEIALATGIRVLDLPLERSFYIDLGFPLWC